MRRVAANRGGSRRTAAGSGGERGNYCVLVSKEWEGWLYGVFSGEDGCFTVYQSTPEEGETGGW